ncbi:MAG: outer-membrane lipoprotein carrier protein LolA [Bacteroidales bacterium]|nr:outer-membrane lipoprotein carrier protein LolA [Bacteroidales bacterium]
MKRFIYTSALVALSFTCATAQLKNAEGNSVISKIKAANEKVNTISCKFDRTIKQAMLDQPAKSDGDFNYTKSRKLSMKYTSGEQVVVNENEVLIGKKGKTRNLKASNKHVESLVNTLLGCVSGNVNSLEGTLESVKETGGKTLITVDVDNFKVGQSKVTKVELEYGSDLIIQSIKMIEADGSYTFYELQTKSLNKQIDESVYVVKK